MQWSCYVDPCRWPLKRCCPARYVLMAICAVLVVHHCWILLEKYLSEPTSMLISYTDRRDVMVPSVTICRRSTKASFLGSSNVDEDSAVTNISVAKVVWESNQKLRDLLLSCEPGCDVEGDVSFLGGRVDVPTGSWSTWVQDDALCHTFTANITWWTVTALTHGQANRDLTMELNTAARGLGTMVTLHPRRWPVFGGTGVEDDETFYVHPGVMGKFFVESFVRDYENLNRAPCQPSPGYFQEECMYACFVRLWIKLYNCSLPQMLTNNFPHLPECSPRHLDFSLNMVILRDHCKCPNACLYRMLGVNVAKSKMRIEKANTTWLIFIPARVPEEVATFRSSYGLSTMMSELGGYISLLLGVSVMSLFDLATNLIRGCCGGTAVEKTEPTRTLAKIRVAAFR